MNVSARHRADISWHEQNTFLLQTKVGQIDFNDLLLFTINLGNLCQCLVNRNFEFITFITVTKIMWLSFTICYASGLGFLLDSTLFTIIQAIHNSSLNRMTLDFEGSDIFFVFEFNSLHLYWFKSSSNFLKNDHLISLYFVHRFFHITLLL